MADDATSARASIFQPLKRAVSVIFSVWLVGHLLLQIGISIQHFARGEEHTVATYGVFYAVILGGLTLWFREPIAAAMRQSRVPNTIWYLGVGLIYVVIEEMTCYFTNSGIWGSPETKGVAFPWLFAGIAALFGWVLGSYIAARFFKLGKMEIFVLTTLAGWFMEVAISRPTLFARPLTAFAWLPWAMYTYGLFIAIPLLVIPGPEPERARSGRWWRYPLTFVLPLACMVALGGPMFELSKQLTGS